VRRRLGWVLSLLPGWLLALPGWVLALPFLPGPDVVALLAGLGGPTPTVVLAVWAPWPVRSSP
jgi:hypothetical protein